MTVVFRLKLPYPAYLWRVIRYSAVMWLLVRVLFAVLMSPDYPTYGIPAVLVWIDRKRNHEQLLFANLGGSDLWFWTASLLTSVLLDLAAFALLTSAGGLRGSPLFG